MNSYADLTTLKSEAYLNITTTDATRDVRLLRQLEAASRMIDKYCRRFFYCDETTRYFDGAGNTFWLPDVLSISTLKTDDNNDKTYENSYTENTDYYLLPYNEAVKTRAVIRTGGSYSGFASGIAKGIEIAGVFGYGNGDSATPYFDSGDAVANDPSQSAALLTLTVTAGTNFSIGQTIRIDDEQQYITGISTNTLTVERGVNGTTAAAHLKDATIYIYEYPWDIVHACLIQTMRWYKRKDSAYQDIVGIPEMGTFITSKGLDPDVKMILNQYRKIKL